MEKIRKYVLISATAVLFFSIALNAVAQPPCDIKYFVINPNSEVLPGPLVLPGYYTVYTGLASSTNWWTHGQFQFEGGHKYMITMMDLPENDGSVYLGVDTAELASYPSPTQDMAAIYYVNSDDSDVYKVTVCP